MLLAWKPHPLSPWWWSWFAPGPASSFLWPKRHFFPQQMAGARIVRPDRAAGAVGGAVVDGAAGFDRHDRVGQYVRECGHAGDGFVDGLGGRWPLWWTLVVVLVLSLFVGEVLPKIFAVRRPEVWARRVAHPLAWLQQVTRRCIGWRSG
jgi:hypothetical protein